MSYQYVTVTLLADFFVLPYRCPGYGARIFIRRGKLHGAGGAELRSFMNYACAWGGADKEWMDRNSGEVFEGFELPPSIQSSSAAEGIGDLLEARRLVRGKLEV